MNELNNFFLGVQQVAQDAVDKAPYDRTFRGVIVKVNNDGTCNVRINDITYTNVRKQVAVQVNDSVDVLFPQNNPSQMRVVSQSMPLLDISSYFTPDTTYSQNHQFKAYYIPSLRMVCLHMYAQTGVMALNADVGYDICNIDEKYRPIRSRVALSFYSGKLGQATARNVGNIRVSFGSNISQTSTYDMYIDGFWFV